MNQESETSAIIAQMVAKEVQAAQIALGKQFEDARREMLANAAPSHALRTKEPPSRSDLEQWADLKLRTTSFEEIVKMTAGSYGLDENEYVRRSLANERLR